MKQPKQSNIVYKLSQQFIKVYIKREAKSMNQNKVNKSWSLLNPIPYT